METELVQTVHAARTIEAVRTLQRGWVGRLMALVPDGARSLVALALGSLALLAVTLLLQAADPRQLLGASVWLKPAKFAASVVLTAATLAVLLIPLQPLTRGMRRAVALISWLTTLELVAITVQSARGVASHFNNATPFDTALFSGMGAAIIVVWGAMGYLGWRAFREPFADRAMGWGIRMGFAAMLLGAGLGGLMTRPTAAQLESLAARRPTPVVGAHAVGVADGGPGLPGTRWSTEGGDLRVPHFIGLHGLQLLPLGGWWMVRRRRGRVVTPARDVRDGRLVAVAGLGYIGLVVVTAAQALRGQPLLAPDGLTALSLAALAVAMLGAALALSLPARARRPAGWQRPTPAAVHWPARRPSRSPAR